MTHEIQIRCPAASIPEFLVCDISALQLGQSIHVNELKLPEGAIAITPGGVVVVQVATQTAGSEEAAAITGAEPELIRKEKPAEAGS
jgi:large subunit ribosomal protein L25